MKEIKTIWGQDFCQFHHELTENIIPGVDSKKFYNFSDWFNKHRNITDYYYLHYLALFLVHGVLFENFITKNGEREFTENKVLPSFYKLQEIFGIKPLIVPISSLEDEQELYWCYYPAKAKKIVACLSEDK